MTRKPTVTDQNTGEITTQTTPPITPEQLAKLSVYGRLTGARNWIHAHHADQLGAHDKGAFGNILGLAAMQPIAASACEHYGICIHFEFGDTEFKAFVTNCDKPEEIITFRLPMARAQTKSANEAQQLGATLSYFSRYSLYSIFMLSSAGADLDSVSEPIITPMHGLPREPLTPRDTWGKPPPPTLVSSPETRPVTTLADRIIQLERITDPIQLDRYWGSVPPAERSPELITAIDNHRSKIARMVRS